MIVTDVKKLSNASEWVLIEDAENIIKELEKELELSERPGVGLAAPQIGIMKNVAIIRTKLNQINLVNPIIKEKNDLFISKGEGCLSLPGIVKDTWRYKEIFVVDDLHPAGFVATDFEATVIQHEVDHLNGILITDYNTRVGRNDPCPCGATDKNGKPIKFKKCHGRVKND
jgi:peptide deformylase